MSQEPDNFEKGMRFGCGAILGIGVGVVIAIRVLLITDSNWAWMAVPFAAAIAGLLAIRFGERFWEAASKWLPWT